MSNDKRRAAMAAHLGEIVAVGLRGGTMSALAASSILTSARWSLDPDANNEGAYRIGLESAGLTPEQIDAAVAAIERGDLPPTSLPAKVVEMRNEARGDHPGSTATRSVAAVVTLDRVLDRLGVSP